MSGLEDMMLNTMMVAAVGSASLDAARHGAVSTRRYSMGLPAVQSIADAWRSGQYFQN